MLKRITVFIVLMGWLFLVCPSLCSFSPLYANQSYSCRCFPCFDGQLFRADETMAQLHVKMCELRSYVQELDKHVSFMESVFLGDNSAALSWFNNVETKLRQKMANIIKNFYQAHVVKLSNKQLKEFKKIEASLSNKNNSERMIQQLNDVKNHIPELSCSIEIYAWIRGAVHEINEASKEHMQVVQLPKDIFHTHFDSFNTQALQSAWKNLIATGSFDDIKTCWNALVAFLDDRNKADFELIFKNDLAKNECKPEAAKTVAVAFLGVKDMTTIIHLLHAYFILQCKEFCGSDTRLDAQMIMNLMEIYSAVNALPIERAIDAIRDLIRDFINALDNLNQSADDHFVGWLKNKWVYMPLAMGVMIVKIVQCLSGTF